MTEQFQPQDQGASSGTADMSKSPTTGSAAVPFERKLTDALTVVKEPSGEIVVYRNNGLHKRICFSHQTGSYRFQAIMQGMFELGIAEQKRRTGGCTAKHCRVSAVLRPERRCNFNRRRRWQSFMFSLASIRSLPSSLR